MPKEEEAQTSKPQFLPQETTLATTCRELQPPQSIGLRTCPPGVSLTLFGKRRGENGDLLLLQLPDFILQLDHSLPNCLDLERMTGRTERNMWYSRPPRSSVLLLPGESRSTLHPLTFWKNSSSGLPSRAVPGCTSATRSLSSSSELLSPCQGQSHWYHFLAAALTPQDPQASGIFLPGHQPSLPVPKTRTPSFQSVFPPPVLLPRLLTCLSSWVLSRMAVRAPLPGARAPRASRF
jgi:hypothetical protein